VTSIKYFSLKQQNVISLPYDKQNRPANQRHG
jgi:hypothetical protein